MSEAIGKFIISLRRLNPARCLRVIPARVPMVGSGNDKETSMTRHEVISDVVAKVGASFALSPPDSTNFQEVEAPYDPIFALIASAAADADALNAAAKDITDQDPLWERQSKSENLVWDTKPVTIAGAYAKIEWARSYGRNLAECPSPDAFNRVWQNLLPTIRRRTALSASAAHDPVFAAIERFRRADGAFRARADYEDELQGAGKELQPASGDYRTQEMVAIVEETVGARRALANAVPTTPQGLAALIALVHEQSLELDEFLFEERLGDELDEQMSFITSLNAAVRGMADYEPSAAADAELIALGNEHDQYVARFRASVSAWEPLFEEHKRCLQEWRSKHPSYSSKAFGKAYSVIMRKLEKRAPLPHPDDILDARSDELSHIIMNMPATTIAGLAVKARLAAFSAPNLWKASDANADWDDLCIRKLIDSVLTAAGNADSRA